MRFNLPAIAPEKKRVLCLTTGLPAEAADAELIAQLAQFVRGLGLPTRLGELRNVSLAGVDWEAVAEETTKMVLILEQMRADT
jgi:hypothetical protein